MSHHRHTLRDAIVDEQAKAAGWPVPEREYRFDPTRRWRFDYAWPEGGIGQEIKIGDGRRYLGPYALEIQGGIWNRGKHGRGSGILKDYEKLNAAQALGWRVLQLTPQQVENGELRKWLEKMK